MDRNHFLPVMLTQEITEDAPTPILRHLPYRDIPIEIPLEYRKLALEAAAAGYEPEQTRPTLKAFESWKSCVAFVEHSLKSSALGVIHVYRWSPDAPPEPGCYPHDDLVAVAVQLHEPYLALARWSAGPAWSAKEHPLVLVEEPW